MISSRVALGLLGFLFAFGCSASDRRDKESRDAQAIETAMSVKDGALANATDTAKPLRIAVGYFSHEATTFSPDRAGPDDFSPQSLTGEALFNYYEDLQGFQKAAEEYHNVTLVPLESFGDVIGGSSVGYITREAFDLMSARMIRDLKDAGAVDAVFLSLHGCAAVEGVERPEAELARRIREAVGPDTPIAGVFDPHGNEDDAFLQHAEFSLAYKYFPHYDPYLQGERAARLLVRAARGDYVSTTATRKPGIITPTVLQWTGADPWMSIVQRALVWEAREPDVFVSVFTGFPWNDSVDAGATIQVMTNNDQALADLITEDMSAFMQSRRHELFSIPILQPDDAVAKAEEAVKNGATPTVLADYSDRGGDATHILSQIIDQNLSNVIYATLRDERLIKALADENAAPGTPFDREVGGFAIAEASGAPVRVQGTLIERGATEVYNTDIEYAVIAFGDGNRLIVSDQLLQIMHPEAVRAFKGIDPDQFSHWVLKSRAHFRRGFDDTGYAKTIMIVDAPGPYLGTIHLDALPFKKVNLADFFPYNEGGINAARGR
ncbi:MAG: M81 family metallopeptidase [Pseudomonadota bacterium]